MRTVHYFLLCFCLGVSTLKAGQSVDSLRLVGRVKDHVTRRDILGSMVELLSAKDSLLLASTEATLHYRSGERRWTTGEYAFVVPKREASYILRISKEGYAPAYIDLSVGNFYKREIHRDIGIAYLKAERTKKLDEVIVQASKVKFYHKGDTLVYNADAFQLAEGSMLDALIRQMPGAELRKDGQIYVNGKFVESLLLNGKDFFRGDSQVLLENLPAYTVRQVQVYEKLGEDSKFVGQEVAGDKRFVIDVKLKREHNIGWLANLEAGVGTEGRYLARLFTMRYTDHSRLALFANINNLNDGRKPGEQDGWKPSDLVGGETRHKIGGIDYHTEGRDGKYKLYSSLKVSHTDQRMVSRTNRTNFLPTGDTYERILDEGGKRNLTIAGKSQLYWDLGQANLEISPNISYNKYDNRGRYLLATLNEDFVSFGKDQLDSLYSRRLGRIFLSHLVNRNLKNTYGEGHSLHGDLGVKSIIKFRNSPDYLKLYVGASLEDASQSDYSHNKIEYYSSDRLSDSDFRNRYFDVRPGKGWGFVGSITYSHIFARKLFVNWTYKYERRASDRYSSLFRLDQLPDWGESSTHELGDLPSVEAYARVMDAANSYNSHRIENKHTIEPFFVWTKDKERSQWSGQLAVPLSLLSRQMDYRRASTDTVISKRNILLDVYSSYIRWNTKDQKYKFEFQYKLKSQAPDMHLFADITDSSDPLNVTKGNPNLKPSYKHGFISNFTRLYPKQKLMLIGEAYLAITQNDISMSYVYDPSTGVRTFRPMNVNGNWRAQLSMGMAGAINKSKTLNLRFMSGIAYENNVDFIGTTGTSARRNEVGDLELLEEIHLSYKIGRSTIGLKSAGTWNRLTNPQMETLHTADFNYGLTAQLQLPWKLQLGTDLTVYARRGYQDRIADTDDLVWNARLSRPFMKGKLIVMLDGFDILGQLSNVSRRINAQGITETYTNVIPRYMLFHAIYRFNALPRKR